MMTKTSCLIRIFLRSLLIQSSFNAWRMQNLGVAFSVIPLIKAIGMGAPGASGLMRRHLQVFNTHPCLSGAVLGSVVKLEESAGEGREIEDLKQTLMAPYAAMGDAFFSGAWRPFTAVAAVALSLEGVLWAPLIFFLLYNPPAFYVRVKGFIEGYRRGRRGIEFIGRLDLPGLAGRVRRVSAVLLGLLTVMLAQSAGRDDASISSLLTAFLFSGVVLVCFWLVTRGVSAIIILYGAVALLLLLSV
jgi:PTS system mannose-specific IID component